MTFVQVSQSLVTHRKTLRLARLLGIDRYAVVGRLVALWSWCLDNALDGCLGDIETDILADVMGWEGKPGDLVEAMLTAGFLELRDEVFWIHDWHDHMGSYIEREEERQRSNRERQQRFRDRHQPRNAEHNGSVTVTPALRNADITGHMREEEIITEERESARAHTHTRTREGNLVVKATADAAPVSLSLSQTPSAPEPEAEQTPEPSPPTPVASEHPLHEACVVALGHGPTTGRMRRKWRDGLADLAANHVTPDDIPKLVRQYRAKFGDTIPCEPWNLADHYPELGVSPHVLNGASQRPVPEDHPDPAEFARQKRAALEKYGVPYPPNHRAAIDG